MDNRWLDSLRRRMEAHTETPPAGLWEDTERALDRVAAFAVRSKRRRMLIWGTSTGAAASVIAVFFVLFGGVGPENDTTAPRTPMLSQEYGSPVSDSGIASTRPLSSISPDPVRKIYSATHQAAIADSGSDTGDTVSVPDHATASEATPETALAIDDPTPENRPTFGSEIPAAFGTYDDDPVSRPRTKKSKWQASLFAANISSGVSAVDGNGNGPMALESADYYTFDDTSYAYNAKVTMPTYTDVRHRQPLTVGISVGYSFDERWSLTSGVTYTMLSSTFRIESNRASQTHEQRLHNVGIPLNINYNILRSRRFSLYLSAGGVVEKSVAGTLTRKIATNGSSDLPRKESVSDRIQWSAGAFVGGQWDFAKRTGIYVEPGVSYRFDNHSAVETIYKERPVNFDLRFGLRFSFE